MTDIEIVVSATKGRSPSDLTVAELGITLVFANRLANRIFAGEHSAQDLSAFNSEPDAVSLRIKEIRQGSVIINAAVELANDPFAQGVAASIAADILSPSFRRSIRSLNRSMGRLSRVAAGKAITVVVRVGKSSIRIVTNYPKDGRSSTRIYDDTQ